MVTRELSIFAVKCVMRFWARKCSRGHDVQMEWASTTRSGTGKLKKSSAEEVRDVRESDWSRLHGDYVGVATMMHSCGKWGVTCDRRDLIQKMKKCKVCKIRV